MAELALLNNPVMNPETNGCSPNLSPSNLIKDDNVLLIEATGLYPNHIDWEKIQNLWHVYWCSALEALPWHKTPKKMQLGVKWVHFQWIMDQCQSLFLYWYQDWRVYQHLQKQMGTSIVFSIVELLLMGWVELSEFCAEPFQLGKMEGNNKLGHFLSNLKKNHPLRIPEDQVSKTHMPIRYNSAWMGTCQFEVFPIFWWTCQTLQDQWPIQHHPWTFYQLFQLQVTRQAWYCYFASFVRTIGVCPFI